MATRLFRKGEVIFEEGDALEKFFIVQTGSVQLGLRKDKKFLDFFSVGPNGFLGEYGLLGHTQHLFTAVARSETQVLEIPRQALKDELNDVPGFVKILVKSSLERLKISFQTIRSIKSPDQLSLFPSERLPLYFAAAFFTLKEKAVETRPQTMDPKAKKYWVVGFPVFRSQLQRVFGLSMTEITNFCHLMWRLGLFSVEEQINQLKDWSTVEQITVYNIECLRFFFDFYQYYFFKSGREDVLKLDQTLLSILEEIMECQKAGPEVLLSDLEVKVQAKLNLPLNADHFSRFEKKGVFVQRIQKGNVNYVEGDWKELTNVLWSWRFLNFCDLANQNGNVEFEVVDATAAAENQCAECKTEFKPSQKFCANCGAPLAVAKVA